MKKLLLSVWRPCLGIWLAAAFLGLGYSALSPLGVRFKTSPTPPAAPSFVLPVKPASVTTPYSNEVLAVRLERPALAQGAGSVYQNETLGLAVLPGAGLGSDNSLPTLPGLTWPQAKALAASNLVLLVDARTSAAYQAGHIPGAVSLPSDAPPEEYERFKARYPKDTPLVLYCGSASCPMSLRLAQNLLTQHGYTNLRHIPGGFVEYRLAEHITETAAVAAPATTNQSPR